MVFFALIAPASFGQAASLTGQSFESSPGLGGQTTFDPYTCNRNGTTVIPFQSEGAALGPYSGTFTETGTITIGPQTDTSLDTRGAGAILDFQASFTIMSPAGTVTGTKQLAPTAPTGASLSAFGLCEPNASPPPNTDLFAIVSNPFVVYDAQIIALADTRTDSGTAGFFIQSIPNPALPPSFREDFNSTEPVPPSCEGGNHGNGHGHGHGKKRGHDDEEECEDEDEDED